MRIALALFRPRAICLPAIVCAIACLSAEGCEFAEDVSADNQQAAKPIIAAVEAYKRDHGRYPSELSALVPAYLPEIKPPKATENGTWEYWVSASDDEFQVGYSGKGRHYNGTYSSKGRRWYIDNK